jgi:PAS domain S-box-containing protein
MEDLKQSTTIRSVRRLLSVLLASIAVGELLIMLLLRMLPPLPNWGEALVDAASLLVLLVPCVYLAAFRPLVRHITERERVEAALALSESHFREIFDDAPVGYHEVDAEGRVARVNRTELTMLGYSPGEMAGRHVWEFTDDPETSRKAVLDKLAGRLPPARDLERTYRKRDGTWLPVSIQDRLLRDQGGAIIGIRSTLQDFTERKRAEAEREKLIAELRQALAEVKTLKGFVPICAWCKKVRNDKGFWDQVESYVERHTGATFSHGICPECSARLSET